MDDFSYGFFTSFCAADDIAERSAECAERLRQKRGRGHSFVGRVRISSLEKFLGYGLNALPIELAWAEIAGFAPAAGAKTMCGSGSVTPTIRATRWSASATARATASERGETSR